MELFSGRLKPYTEIGVRRKRCTRCGSKAVHQWSICANANRYVPICLECDIAVNELVLKFLKIPHVDKLIERYKQG